MVRIGRLDFEAGNHGGEYDTIFADIQRRWEEEGPTPLSELGTRLSAQGIDQKKINAAVKYLEDNGLIEVEWSGPDRVAVPKHRVAVSPVSPWLTLEQAVRYLRVSRRTIYAWTKSGRLTAYRTEPGGTLRFRTEDLDRCLSPIGSEATAISGAEDTVLTELWDNDADAAYDNA